MVNWRLWKCLWPISRYYTKQLPEDTEETCGPCKSAGPLLKYEQGISQTQIKLCQQYS